MTARDTLGPLQTADFREMCLGIRKSLDTKPRRIQGERQWKRVGPLAILNPCISEANEERRVRQMPAGPAPALGGEAKRRDIDSESVGQLSPQRKRLQVHHQQEVNQSDRDYKAT